MREERVKAIEASILAIVERAEYAGRQDGISKATRSSRRSREAHEAADVSIRMARMMARDLAEELAR